MSLNSQNSICISIEGNIGSGKSTLLKILSRKDDIDVIKEPVISWQKIGGNPKNNLLEAFY
jgi:deoxyadenosine/deoxycytidine kinase